MLPILPRFSSDLGAGIGLIGLVIAAHGAGQMAGDVPSGILVSRFGRQKAMLVAMLGMAVSSVGAGFSHTIALLITMRFVTGLSFSLWGVSRHIYVSNVVPVGHRGRAMALLGGTGRIGMFIGPIIGGFLGSWAGIEWPLFLFAAIAIITLGFMITDQVGEGLEDNRYTVGNPLTTLANVFRKHRYELSTAGLVNLVLSTIREGRQLLVPLWAEHIGLGIGSLGLLFGIASAFDMTLFVLSGIVMDRWGRKWVIIPSALIMAAGVTLIPATHGFAELLGACILIALGNGIGSGAMFTLGADLAPRHQGAEFLGIWRLIGDSGRTMSPFAIGLIGQTAALTAACMTIAGAGVLAALLTALLVKETLHGPHQSRGNRTSQTPRSSR